MAENKKHHLVPRFYLKHFSDNEKCINLFNIKSRTSVFNGGLRNQCYRDYFYGKDLQTEKALSLVESHMSRIMRSIKAAGALPSRISEDRLTFLLHVVMQHTRTAYSVDAFDEQTEKLMKHLIALDVKGMNLPSEEIANSKIRMKDSARFALGIAAPNYTLLIDLEWKLIKAPETHEFITSDNPVVYYNQLFSFRKNGCNTGLASKGLQIFFPLSPKYLVLLYDAKVYGVGPRRSEIIDIVDPRDVAQINRLQFVSALENVYFHDRCFPTISEFQAAESYRRKQKSRMQSFPGQETVDRFTELLLMSKVDIYTNLELSFVRILKPAKEWLRSFRTQSRQPLVIVRNKQLSIDHETFLDMVKAKRYKHGEFFKYLREKFPTS